ncbi:hypothetical protein GC174_08670 [bacterium]|nr:hypothetical protein [bacterium]
MQYEEQLMTQEESKLNRMLCIAQAALEELEQVLQDLSEDMADQQVEASSVSVPALVQACLNLSSLQEKFSSAITAEEYIAIANSAADLLQRLMPRHQPEREALISKWRDLAAYN